MNRIDAIRQGRWTGLAFALALSCLFLGACAWWIYRDLEFDIAQSKITGSIVWEAGIGPVMTRRLFAFAGAVLLVHLLPGLVAWCLGRLSLRAFPGIPATRQWALIGGWMLLLVLLALGGNAAWYPASDFAAGSQWLLGTFLGTIRLYWLMAAAGLAALAVAVLAWHRSPPRPVRLRAGLVGLVLLALVAGIPAALDAARAVSAEAPDRPHIVILGIDSLRADLAEATEDHALTPRIDAFLADSHRFTDTMSPLARTYGSWVSILTGRHPITTNARFNLMPRTAVREGETLADALRTAGYQTVYATDETRFANFDESFGFEVLITPPIGASDFVLGRIGDLPLVNLAAGTRAGGWLFPANHANRAAYITYQPEDFNSRLERELRVDGPGFYAIHLTLAHWPYSWAGHAMPTTPQASRPAYRTSLEMVDRQFEEVLKLLERNGVLKNAYVVVLSDHGEALGFPSDTMLRKTGSANDIWNSIWGHGTSVMSPHQYAVVLAIRAYGRARLPGAPGAHDWPVSLEDVRPTLQELATGRAPADVDGISLLPYLSGVLPAESLAGRVRYTETCFNTPMTLAGKINPSGLIGEAARYYELEPSTGWMQLRSERLPELLLKKQRAAISKDSLLARLPSWSDDSVTWLYSDRRSPLPRRLAGPPDPGTDPEAARLWDALHTRFAGELPPPADLP